MRGLTVQEVDQASGGILPIVGVAVALAGLVVRHQVASAFIGGAGLVLAGHSLVGWGRNRGDNRMCNSH